MREEACSERAACVWFAQGWLKSKVSSLAQRCHIHPIVPTVRLEVSSASGEGLVDKRPRLNRLGRFAFGSSRRAIPRDKIRFLGS
jgi:hypothetical protein